MLTNQADIAADLSDRRHEAASIELQAESVRCAQLEEAVSMLRQTLNHSESTSGTSVSDIRAVELRMG